jgi:alpha-L-fucosidase
MKNTRREFLTLAGAAALVGPKLLRTTASTPTFTPDLDSLRHYRAPEWFRDAKLGIWACWGPEAVPEMGDWYARQMYIQGHPQYEDHLKRYGHPSKFGYKDLVPLWRGENWDPDRLMQSYKGAGAKYFCAIAQHHDNIDCWNSKFHSWNSVTMGPRKDVIGVWRKAAKKSGLRFGVTEHLGASWNWYGVSKLSDKTGPLAGVPYDGVNPKFADLYHSGNENSKVEWWYRNVPDSWKQEWFNRIKDLVDSYQPDLLYSDGSLPFGEYGRNLLAHFYNANVRQHEGKLEAVYTCKRSDDGGEFAEGMCVQDVERGVQDEIKAEPWQTDTCVGDWYYKREIQYKTPTLVIHMLVDIVSKNGNLLLNFPVRADGTLDSEEEKILESLSEWMSINGEAIHGTRPWKVYGEGPNMEPATSGGAFNEGKRKPLTAEDIRFTSKGNVVNVFILGWPEKEIVVGALGTASPQMPGKVVNVELLGHKSGLKWTQDAEGLRVQLPSEKPCDHAVTLQVALG